mmetsp:Transcript_11767/g.20686  ORF Transcript_11767/g.20686 Transcript_11767/m.20686 type:complete len:254 (-) Transcript_11767:266-1027(-)
MNPLMGPPVRRALRALHCRSCRHLRHPRCHCHLRRWRRCRPLSPCPSSSPSPSPSPVPARHPSEPLPPMLHSGRRGPCLAHVPRFRLPCQPPRGLASAGAAGVAGVADVAERPVAVASAASSALAGQSERVLCLGRSALAYPSRGSGCAPSPCFPPAACYLSPPRHRRRHRRRHHPRLAHLVLFRSHSLPAVRATCSQATTTTVRRSPPRRSRRHHRCRTFRQCSHLHPRYRCLCLCRLRRELALPWLHSAAR